MTRVNFGKVQGSARGRVTLGQVHRYLHQDYLWLDQRGNLRSIDGLEENHQRNILRWLERHAEEFWFLEGMDHLPTFIEPIGERAQEALDHEIDSFFRETPLEWIRSTPVFRAIQSRLDA